VLSPGAQVTAIEVDYNSVWASPTSEALDALFAAVVRVMDANGRSDAGAHLEGWLVEAGFESVDPGERRLAYSGDGLVRQVPYVAAVVESTLAPLLEMQNDSAPQLKAGLAELRALPKAPDAAIGWALYKANAIT
jgi:hypothetical protein